MREKEIIRSSSSGADAMHTKAVEWDTHLDGLSVSVLACQTPLAAVNWRIPVIPWASLTLYVCLSGTYFPDVRYIWDGS
jgi:hypothetical protein